MPLVAIGGIAIKHWIWTPEFFWRSRQSLRQAHADGDCLHARIFAMKGLYFSLTAWRNGAAMKRFARSGPHRIAVHHVARFARPLHFRHVQMDEIPRAREAYALWLAGTPHGTGAAELPLVNSDHTP